MFEEVPEEPARTRARTTAAAKAPVKQMSQAAVASFVYGTLQIIVTTLAVVAVFALHSVSSTLSQYTQTLSGLGTSIPSTSLLNNLGLVILISSNLFAVLGFLTGIVALVEIKKGMTGEGLATIGMVSSVGCAIISILMAQSL